MANLYVSADHWRINSIYEPDIRRSNFTPLSVNKIELRHIMRSFLTK